MSGTSTNTRLTPLGRVKKSSSVFGSFQKASLASPQKANGAYANLNSAPVPEAREVVQSTHTAFCEFQRKNGKNGSNNQNITKTAFIKNMLAILLQVDKKAAILGYKKDSQINSICHPNHVPENQDEFELYFPRTYTSRGYMLVKCRVTSSMSLADIKRKARPRLENLHYFMWPTLLQATRTAKAGWLYLAHPDLTHRGEIHQTLQPIILARLGKEVEFQAVPELETITIHNNKIQQRVLTIRCAYESVDEIRDFFTTTFSDESLNIGYLARYTFVSSKPIAECTWNHLYHILSLQQQFHKTVHWYIVHGISNMDQTVPLIQPEVVDVTDTQTDESTENNDNNQDVDMETANLKRKTPDNTQASQSTDQAAVQQSVTSLRMYLYSLQDPHGNNLIHSVYPSVDTKKTFVLCSQQNREAVLKLLHNLEATINAVFVPEAVQKYISQPIHIPGYPRVTAAYRTYASSIIGITNSNPQDQPDATVPTNVPPPKRHHSGAQKDPPSNLPAGFSQARTHTVQMKETINETMARLKQLEANDTETKTSLSSLSDTVNRQGNDIHQLGQAYQDQNKLIQDIQDTQVTQGAAIERMDSKQETMLRQLNLLVQRSAQTNHTESPHGGGVPPS